MTFNHITLENKLKGLRLFYFAFGIPVIIYGFLTLLLVVLMSNDPYLPFSLWFYEGLLWGIGYFSAGILFFITYYGLKTRKRFSKITGLIGCTMLIIITVLIPLLRTASLFRLDIASFLIVSILLIVLTLTMWKDISNDEHIKISRKMRKVITICVVVILAISVSWVVIPQIYKNILLGSVEYVNYEYGFGLNPPDGWEVEDSFQSFTFSHLLEDNSSEEAILDGILAPSTTGKQASLNPIVESLLESYESYLPNNTANFSLVSHGEKTVNGMDAYEFIYVYEKPYENSSLEIKQKEIWVVSGSKTCKITYTCPLEYYDLYIAIVDQSVNTLVMV